MPPGGGMPDGMASTRSAANGVDLASMVGSGAIGKDQTIREFMQGLGINVDGPVTQLVEWQQKQMAMKKPIDKMPAMASQGPQQGANPPGRPPLATTGPSGGDLDSLRREVMG